MAVELAGAIDDVQRMKKQTLAEQFGGKPSNQFVTELKGSTLFQFNWSELLSAAPTALSLMGSCWIAAAAPKAEQIDMTDSVPVGGFKYLTNNRRPTLRSCLVDVCNRGGRDAFVVAGKNMDALQIRSQRICVERIDLVFKRLGPCTRDEDALDDFKDSLEDFAKEARECATLATETRIAFSNWGKMVGELHACTENQQGAVSIKRETVSIDADMAEIEEKFASKAADAAKASVAAVGKQLERAEKRLDIAIDKVPGPWETVVQGAVTGFTQAIPNIVAGVLPAVLAAANPVGSLMGGLAGGLKQQQGNMQTTLGAVSQQTVAPTAFESGLASASPAAQPAASDPAFAAAVVNRELISTFFDFLGGEKGTVDWSKFSEAKSDKTAADTPAGITYFLGNLTGQRKEIAVTGTEPNKKLLAAFDESIKVATEIQERVRATGFSTEKVTPEVISAWKAAVKKAKEEVLQLASAGNASGSNNVPNPFANVKIDLPKTDHAAQTAQVNGAMQAAQMAQTAVDAAQANYDAAVSKQAQTQAAMLEVQKKLKALQETGRTLDEIKSVLKDCISVLVDLAIQVGKLESFFTMLTTVIDNIVLVRADTFTKEMGKAGRRALANGTLKIDDIAKQTIYTATLQLKAYFSLLADISSMYSQVNRGYIVPGMELCMKLSKGAAGSESMPALADQLGTFTQDSAKAVAELVDTKQKEVLAGLKDRARMAAESTQLLESTVTSRGLEVDHSAKKAIERGAEMNKEEAKNILNASVSETVSNSETVDASMS